jgi:Zn-dependent peptidase ImmA (M78 family)
MLSAYLVRMIENHAEDLTREVLDDLTQNPKTPAWHTLSRDELHRRVYDLYHNLGHWLADKSEALVERTYSQMGRERFAEHVPLTELVFATMLIKDHLRNFIRRAGVVYSALELHREVELNLMIGHFFDKALYYAVTGYEEARAESASTQLAAGRAGR